MSHTLESLAATAHRILAAENTPQGRQKVCALLSEVLVDHVDLDGDRMNEVVTMTMSFEGATYKIYHKQKNRWANIYEFYSYRCAY